MKRVMEMNHGDGCTTVRMHLILLTCIIFNLIEDATFYMYFPQFLNCKIKPKELGS